jgi:GAF domain-containing protein
MPVRYIEPQTSNQSALGFDLAADPAQLAAVEQARDSGEATLTPKITIGSGQGAEPGFLLLVPVYRRYQPQTTVDQRRAALLGWVIAPIRSKPLLQGILGPGTPEIDVEVFDGNEPQPGDLLYDSSAGQTMTYPPTFAENQLISVVGRPWKLGFTTLPDFDAVYNNNASILIGAAGLQISLLLAGMTLFLVNNQALAELRAEQMTATLREQNEFLGALQATRLGLLSHQALDETLHSTVERAAELAGTKHGYLFQLEPNGDEMVMKVGTGFFAQRVGDRIIAGQSVAGVAWQSAQPLLVDDYPQWPGRVPSPVFDQLASLAGVPLMLDNRVVGVIGLGYLAGDSGRFVEDDMARLAQIGELASLALQNAQLFSQAESELAERRRAEDELRKAQDQLEQRVQERTAELATLNQIGQVISEQTETGDIVAQVGAQLQRVFQADNAYIALFDRQTNRITLPFLLQRGRLEPTRTLALGPGMIAQIIRNGRPLIAGPDSTETASRIDRQLMGGTTHSFMGVPILSGDDVIGVISVYDMEQARQFGDAETRLLTTIAANVGVALEKAKLLQQAQARARQEYLARSIVSQVSATIDPETILRTAARQLSHALGASHAVVRVGRASSTNGSNGTNYKPPVSQ